MSKIFDTDIAIVGAGAAGLMCAVQAARTAPGARITLVDGARKPGAKILVAGGGRCNVTHESVSERDFCGGSSNAIRRVLRRFDVSDTIEFFSRQGVRLVREETGKLFPDSNKAQSVLDALQQAALSAGVGMRHPFRVETVSAEQHGFLIGGPQGSLRSRALVLATGGRSLPKSGSDGVGYKLAQSLGHHLSPRMTPALVPLNLPKGHWLTALSGLTLPAQLSVHSGSGKRLASAEGSLLCAHFGLSGPVVLDISRHWLAARADDQATSLCVNWLPEFHADELDQALQALGKKSVEKHLGSLIPARLASEIFTQAGLPAGLSGDQLKRDQRRKLLTLLTACPLPISGDRGYNHAEVTAGGVPLDEVQLKTLESRCCPSLYLCGELLDVDGRIGGFNFQWAWASGSVAGWAVAKAVSG